LDFFAGTRTGAALRHVYSNSFQSANCRKDVPKILIVVTDGRSKDAVKRPSRLIKKMKDTKV